MYAIRHKESGEWASKYLNKNHTPCIGFNHRGLILVFNSEMDAKFAVNGSVYMDGAVRELIPGMCEVKKVRLEVVDDEKD